MLLALGIVGGILPDPAALAILLAALSSGKVMLGLATVVVFSLGFAATLVVVGVIAAKVGQKVLEWLSSIWVVRVQIATTLLILGMGVVLTVRAAYQLGVPAGLSRRPTPGRSGRAACRRSRGCRRTRRCRRDRRRRCRAARRRAAA